MGKLALTLSLVTGMVAGVYAQGDLGSQGSLTSPAYPSNIGSFTFDNIANSNPSDTATSGGLAWIGNTLATSALLNRDVNMSISDASGTIVSFFLSDNTANGIGTALGGGQFYDNSGTTYYILGSTGGGTVAVTLDAWTGSGLTYAQAVANNSQQYAGTVTFDLVTGNYTTGGVPSAATDFTAMPALVMVPEPATCVLMGLGGLSLLLFRRRK
jgi:hypothetical protein